MKRLIVAAVAVLLGVGAVSAQVRTHGQPPTPPPAPSAPRAPVRQPAPTPPPVQQPVAPAPPVITMPPPHDPLFLTCDEITKVCWSLGR